MSLKNKNRLQKIKYIQDNINKTNKELSNALGLPSNIVAKYKSDIKLGKIKID
jgi:hypothetical protein